MFSRLVNVSNKDSEIVWSEVSIEPANTGHCCFIFPDTQSRYVVAVNVRRARRLPRL
jgi:hypothetical protein